MWQSTTWHRAGWRAASAARVASAARAALLVAEAARVVRKAAVAQTVAASRVAPEVWAVLGARAEAGTARVTPAAG